MDWDLIKEGLYLGTRTLLSSLLWIVPIGLIIFVYFLPSFIAKLRRHKQTLAIFLLNLLLGWTIIGWVAALIWSVLKQ
jgi:RsiW-degrading membrane proteinase PrsW (M82 family)